MELNKRTDLERRRQLDHLQRRGVRQRQRKEARRKRSEIGNETAKDDRQQAATAPPHTCNPLRVAEDDPCKVEESQPHRCSGGTNQPHCTDLSVNHRPLQTHANCRRWSSTPPGHPECAGRSRRRRRKATPGRASWARAVALLTGAIMLVLATLPAAIAGSPKYETAYACEGKTLMIECEPGDLINLIRANYGRFSITICNDHGNVDWSVNCMSPKSLRVLHSKCAQKQNCSVLASTSMFGDPCPGTHKYLEAHYQCVSAAQSSTTTNRPSPPWLKTSQPIVWSTSTVRSPVLSRLNLTSEHGVGGGEVAVAAAVTPALSTPAATVRPGPGKTSQSPTTFRNKGFENKSVNDDLAIIKTIADRKKGGAGSVEGGGSRAPDSDDGGGPAPPPGGSAKEDEDDDGADLYPTQTAVLSGAAAPPGIAIRKEPTVVGGTTVNGGGANVHIDISHACGPSTARNLFWNVTRVGEQSMVGAATWYAYRPDLTQCRSLWLNNLEVRVQQPESSLISIANDLAQVTSSKTLYGGDMLVATKIIQTMSQKMHYDIETIPDQRQREALVFELLNSVVKTGSNLLDQSQHASWLDLSVEDQMRVATSLLTGLEDNAFLLADTILREKHVVQKVKNILLSIRVLETRNFAKSTELFPDSSTERWQGVASANVAGLGGGNLDGGLGSSAAGISGGGTRTDAGSTHHDSVATPRLRLLNSKVISASLGKGRHIQLSQPIRMILRHLRTKNVSNPTCVFWNYIDHAWSEDGCHVEHTNSTHTVCMCNHLTNFALLVDAVDDETQLSLLSNLDDSLLLYIGVAILVVVAVVALFARKLCHGAVLAKLRNGGPEAGTAAGLRGGGPIDRDPAGLSISAHHGTVAGRLHHHHGVSNNAGVDLHHPTVGPVPPPGHHHHHMVHHHLPPHPPGAHLLVADDFHQQPHHPVNNLHNHHPNNLGSNHHAINSNNLVTTTFNNLNGGSGIGGNCSPSPPGDRYDHHHPAAHHLTRLNNNVNVNLNSSNDSSSGSGSNNNSTNNSILLTSGKDPSYRAHLNHVNSNNNNINSNQINLLRAANHHAQQQQQQQHHHQQQQQQQHRQHQQSAPSATAPSAAVLLQQQQYHHRHHHHHHQPQAAAAATAGTILLQGLGGSDGGPSSPPASSLIASTSLITAAAAAAGGDGGGGGSADSSVSDHSSAAEMVAYNLSGEIGTASGAVGITGGSGTHLHRHQGSIGSSTSSGLMVMGAGSNAGGGGGGGTGTGGTIVSSASSSASASVPLLHHHHHHHLHHHLHQHLQPNGSGSSEPDAPTSAPIPSKRNL
uniref:Uncharacterized protein n=1 Tax=Anopheles farauti TaxID=69004 RepID=A0A182Q5V6_9DIPT